MREPIRILQVFAEMNRGGAETMIMNLYRHIDRSKVQFDFIVHTKNKCAFDDEIAKLGGKIFRVPKYKGVNHFAYKKDWNFFLTNHSEYKVIHGHIRSTASIYLKISKEKGLITIAHSHSIASRGNFAQKVIKNSMQLPIRYIADYFFACSDQAAKWLFGRNILVQDNYKLINNAIEIDKYLYDEEERNKLREFLNLKDKFVVGHVGSFTYPKNHKFLIKIFYEVQKQKKEVALLLVGDGPLRKFIENRIKKLNMSDKVIFIGSVPNVEDYLQVIDVFVFPSLFEGLGIVTIEAQASGLPILVAETIPSEVYLTNLIEKEFLKSSPTQWANKVINCINRDRRFDFSKDISNGGYDIFKTVKWLEKFYLGL